MQGNVQISAALSTAIDDLKLAVAAAIASIPSVPARQDLASATTGDVNLFSSAPIEATLDETSALAGFFGTLTAKFNAFSKAT